MEDDEYSALFAKLSVVDRLDGILKKENSGSVNEALTEYKEVASILEETLSELENDAQKGIVQSQLDYVSRRIHEIEESFSSVPLEGTVFGAIEQIEEGLRMELESHHRLALNSYMAAGESLLSVIGNPNLNDILYEMVTSNLEKCMKRVDFLKDVIAQEAMLRQRAQIQNVEEESESERSEEDSEGIEPFPWFEVLDQDQLQRVIDFLPPRDVTNLLRVSKIFREPRYADCWKNLIIGALPLSEDTHRGHGPDIKWLETCGVTQYARQILFNLGSLDVNCWVSTHECERLGALPLPNLTSLIFTTTYLESPNYIIARFENLTELFIESEVDLSEVAEFLPNLRKFHCNSINMSKFIPKVIHPKLEYLSFVFGVSAINISLLFHCFPGLRSLGIELESVIQGFGALLSQTQIQRICVSWDRTKFWKGLGGRKVLEEEAVQWFKQIHVDNLVLDLDFVLETGQSLQSVLQEEGNSTMVSLAPLEGTSNLRLFLDYN